MEQEYRHAIALMRYSAIAPLIPGLPEGYRNMVDYLEKTSQKGVLHPDGEIRNYAPKTLYKWYFSYQKGGFDALLPAGRNDCGKPSSPPLDVPGASDRGLFGFYTDRRSDHGSFEETKKFLRDAQTFLGCEILGTSHKRRSTSM